MQKHLFLLLFFSVVLYAKNGCINCHGGIEHIRSQSSGMMKAILKKAEEAQERGNDCIICHGGNPRTKNKQKAHFGTIKYFLTHEGPKGFYRAPGSILVNQNTCGMCHKEQVSAQMNSLMINEQEKIQGVLQNFSAKEGESHNVGAYATHNPQELHTRLGTQTYQKYMQELSAREPQAFMSKIRQLRAAPTADEVQKEPSLALYTYLRQKELRGNSRGAGCSSCHIPYSNEGFYKGDDKSINKKEGGHLLVHQIQSSRDVSVAVDNKSYSGIPVQTCNSCHNQTKRIGLSYQGRMQSAQREIHMKGDVHFEKGMLCQDCHTSNDMHGDGFLTGTNLGAVEIECQDCHGTTKAYPWELPLGYSDEFNTSAKVGDARGVTKTVAEYLKKGSINAVEEGYLLSARGNPLTHTSKKGNEVILHLASGKDITLKPLKLLKQKRELSKSALLAMDNISVHTENMECYTCHASWAPQYYGNYVKIDYSNGKKNIDYLMASKGLYKSSKKYLVAGEVTETNAYVRWENPPLSQNGEGRISPTVPGYQTTLTVIGKDTKVLLQNHIFKTPNAMAMSPVQPHTIEKKSRSCESCHSTQQSLGYGVDGLVASSGLDFDYSKFLDANGKQLQSVGHQWSLAAPLSKEQVAKIDRSGSCIACHASIPEANLAVSAMVHISEMTNARTDNKEHKNILNKLLNISVWIQTLGTIFLLMFIIYLFYTFVLKKSSISPKNRGWK